MRRDTFTLFGRDTLEMIDVSYGGAYRARWNLEQHPGPKLLPTALLGVNRVSSDRYLYPQHLELLYGRFYKANPGGVELADEDEIHARYVRAMGDEAIVRLMEARQMFVTLDNTDEDLGYPHLRPYLPEVFEPETVRRMEDDPWLDVRLLGEAMKAGHVPDRRDYHPRWSPEWRVYCDRMRPAR